MFEKQVVEEEALEVLKNDTESGFLQRVTPKLIETLKKQLPDFWKNYGPYWWNLASVLKVHAPRPYREYVDMCGGEDVFGADEEIKKRYDYGTDLLNWAAAQMYLDIRSNEYGLGADNPHQIQDEKGEDRLYIPGIGYLD